MTRSEAIQTIRDAADSEDQVQVAIENFAREIFYEKPKRGAIERVGEQVEEYFGLDEGQGAEMLLALKEDIDGCEGIASEGHEEIAGAYAWAKAEPVGPDTEMPFGKHEGKTLRQIAETDPDYIAWATDKIDDKPALVLGMERAQDLVMADRNDLSLDEYRARLS